MDRSNIELYWKPDIQSKQIADNIYSCTQLDPNWLLFVQPRRIPQVKWKGGLRFYYEPGCATWPGILVSGKLGKPLTSPILPFYLAFPLDPATFLSKVEVGQLNKQNAHCKIAQAL